MRVLLPSHEFVYSLSQLRWLSSRTLDATELSVMRETLLREEAQYQQALAYAFSRFELPD